MTTNPNVLPAGTPDEIAEAIEEQESAGNGATQEVIDAGMTIDIEYQP